MLSDLHERSCNGSGSKQEHAAIWLLSVLKVLRVNGLQRFQNVPCSAKELICTVPRMVDIGRYYDFDYAEIRSNTRTDITPAVLLLNHLWFGVQNAA